MTFPLLVQELQPCGVPAFAKRAGLKDFDIISLFDIMQAPKPTEKLFKNPAESGLYDMVLIYVCVSMFR
jgi:hypothetical protein